MPGLPVRPRPPTPESGQSFVGAAAALYFFSQHLLRPDTELGKATTAFERRLWRMYRSSSEVATAQHSWHFSLRLFAFVCMVVHTIVWGFQEPVLFDANIPGVVDGEIVRELIRRAVSGSRP